MGMVARLKVVAGRLVADRYCKLRFKIVKFLNSQVSVLSIILRNLLLEWRLQEVGYQTCPQ